VSLKLEPRFGGALFLGDEALPDQLQIRAAGIFMCKRASRLLLRRRIDTFGDHVRL